MAQRVTEGGDQEVGGGIFEYEHQEGGLTLTFRVQSVQSAGGSGSGDGGERLTWGVVGAGVGALEDYMMRHVWGRVGFGLWDGDGDGGVMEVGRGEIF